MYVVSLWVEPTVLQIQSTLLFLVCNGVCVCVCVLLCVCVCVCVSAQKPISSLGVEFLTVDAFT